MKKILAVILSLGILYPSFAEDAVLEAAEESSLSEERVLDAAEESAQAVEDPLEVQPETEPNNPWWRGVQFGVGVPVTLTGYNAFIGYANKKSDSWLWRRLGARFDFQIPSALKMSGDLECSGLDADGYCAGYDVNADAKLLFKKFSFDKITDIDPVDVDIDNKDYRLNLDGSTAKVQLKNQFLGGIVDFYPFGDTWFLGGIRLSGGYYTGRMDLSMGATVAEDLPTYPEIGVPGGTPGYRYEVGGGSNDMILAKIKGGSTIGADVKWKYSGPYLGAGFDLGLFAGFKIYMDAGVVFAKPLKISRNNVKAPSLSACYLVNASGECDWISYNLNEKPDVSGLTKEVLAQVIEQNVAKATAGSDFEAIKDKIAQQYNVDADKIDYGRVANDILSFLDFTGTSQQFFADYAAAHSGDKIWIENLSESVADAQDVWNALDDVKSDWQDMTDTDNPDSFQSQIDDAWADYDRGINDINDSLKDMKWMPIVKIGFMYRF